MHDLVRQCQNKLAGIGGLDLVPAEWLHMTTQIMGSADEISDGEVAHTADRLARLVPIEVG